MHLLTFTSFAAIALCILVFLIGAQLLKLFPSLKKLNLPAAVLGGVLFLILFRLIEYIWKIQIVLPMELRDLLLVVFFCSMGLAVRLTDAFRGGKALGILVALSMLLVILQNILGTGIALAFDFHPAYGLLSGSISYVGGFGSSLAWGTYYADQGLPLAREVGFASSAFGLLTGGLLAGPAVAWILRRDKLSGPKSASFAEQESILQNIPEIREEAFTFRKVPHLLFVLFALCICIFLGDGAQGYLLSLGIHLPRFLVAMLVAIIAVNVFYLCKGKIDETEIERVSVGSFNAFIILSLIGMKFAGLSEFVLPMLLCCALQIALTILFSTEIIHRLMGKNYDSAVIAGGVIGFGLSSLAVAVATVKTITGNHGPSPKALLLTALVGAALIDLPNNLLIGLLTRLPFYQVP